MLDYFIIPEIRRYAKMNYFLLFGGMVAITGSFIGYRSFISPKLQRSRRDRNEAFANYVFEMEKKSKSE